MYLYFYRIKTKALNYTVDEMVNKLGFLGLAYDLEIPNADELDVLHSIMEPYNLDTLLRRVGVNSDIDS
jgi:hypothetical protein